MTGQDFPTPVVAWRGSSDPAAPLVVLLHGRGADENGIVALADHLPTGPAYAAVCAPIAADAGYAWFANRGIGRPVAESIGATIRWFRAWLDEIAPPGRPVAVVGISGGAAFGGGLVLDDPRRSTAALHRGRDPLRHHAFRRRVADHGWSPGGDTPAGAAGRSGRGHSARTAGSHLGVPDRTGRRGVHCQPLSGARD